MSLLSNGWGVAEPAMAHGLFSPVPEALHSSAVRSWVVPLVRRNAGGELADVFKAFLESSPEALVFFDRLGTPLWSNRRGEAQRLRWNRGLGPEFAQLALPQALFAGLESGPVPFSLKHPGRPGFSADLMPMPDGGYVLLLRDTRAEGEATNYSAEALAILRKLTSSEQRVARLAAEGLRNADIATRLCRSSRTIENQVASICRKLGVSNRVQLARLLVGETSRPGDA